MDANFAVNLSLQSIQKYGHSAYCVFVELVKAYDTVNRELLWKILKKYGIPEKVIIVLKKKKT